MFDSPFEYCPVGRAYVLLDQTQRQCAREHFCAAVPKCPLQRYFTGMEFRERKEAQGREGEHGLRMTKGVRPRAYEASPASRESEQPVEPSIVVSHVSSK
jgi:hypothetical protein